MRLPSARGSDALVHRPGLSSAVGAPPPPRRRKQHRNAPSPPLCDRRMAAVVSRSCAGGAIAPPLCSAGSVTVARARARARGRGPPDGTELRVARSDSLAYLS